MKIAVLGCGAMGTLFAAYLSQNHDVYMIDRKADHVAAINTNGITVSSAESSAVFRPVLACEDPADVGPCDILIVFVKHAALHAAAWAAVSLISPSTACIFLQNGIGNYEIVSRIIPPEQIYIGTTAHGAVYTGPGQVSHNGRGITRIGTFEGCPDRARRIADALSGNRIECEYSPDIERVIWKKLFANAAINPVAARLGIKNGELLLREETVCEIRGIVKEAVTVANARGLGFDAEEEFQNVIDIIHATSENECSMLQDIKRGRKTEIDAINGAIVRFASELGIEVPANEAAVKALG